MSRIDNHAYDAALTLMVIAKARGADIMGTAHALLYDAHLLDLDTVRHRVGDMRRAHDEIGQHIAALETATAETREAAI